MKFLSILFVAVLVLSGCGGAVRQNGEYRKISPDQAQQMMQDDVIILDVRTPEEFDGGHIENAILLPDYEVKDNVQNISPDKTKTILIYCRTGRRSEIAAKQLINMGYTNAIDFGGIVDWTGQIVQD